MANLKVVKDIIESNPGLQDLNTNNIIKNAAGDIINENINNNNRNNNIGLSIENNCNKFLAKIKGFKEIQNNPEIVKIFNALQNQVKNIKFMNLKKLIFQILNQEQKYLIYHMKKYLKIILMKMMT